MSRERPGGGLSTRRATFTGLGAGVVALGCCVGPAVAALLGLSSAAVAIDLATNLYSDWGWAFKLAGIIFVAVAIGLAHRGSRQCQVKPHLMRFSAIVVATGLVTYGALYAATTTLGQRATG